MLEKPTDQVIAITLSALTGVAAHLIRRPPAGVFWHRLRSEASRLGFQTILAHDEILLGFFHFSKEAAGFGAVPPIGFTPGYVDPLPLNQDFGLMDESLGGRELLGQGLR
jgi:hypothetical protein